MVQIPFLQFFNVIKGFRNIKKMSDVSTHPGRAKISSIPKHPTIIKDVGARGQSLPQRRLKGPASPAGVSASNAVRAWVFTKKPGFTRYQKTLHVQKIEEPFIDVHREADAVTVIAQLPGSTEKDIFLEVKDDILCIEARGHLRHSIVKYHKEILLPFEVSDTSVVYAYNNGILRVDLGRKKEKG